VWLLGVKMTKIIQLILVVLRPLLGNNKMSGVYLMYTLYGCSATAPGIVATNHYYFDFDLHEYIHYWTAA